MPGQVIPLWGSKVPVYLKSFHECNSVCLDKTFRENSRVVKILSKGGVYSHIVAGKKYIKVSTLECVVSVKMSFSLKGIKVIYQIIHVYVTFTSLNH